MEKQREEGRNQTDRGNSESPEIEELQEEGKKKKNETELWARKYAPQGYADLLSDDAVNRNSITWMRLWDECVFKRRHTVQAIESRLNDRERMTFSMENRFGNRARRPHFKILLLTGPAGSGKTTLAGAIARLCGYATVELNASDSRNAPDFEKAIDGALRNQYTIDNGNKPNCLILDEIDGAPADAIKFLAKTIQGTGKKAIKRPIIAICNSLFTTSLRELRPLCLVLNVNAMRRERLVERLQKIAQIENVNIDTFSLEKLVELTECDVRSSLNTLQLLGNSNQGKRITAKQVEQAAESSVQNANKSLFEAFSMVLEFSRHLDNKGHLFSMKQRLQRIERVAIDQVATTQNYSLMKYMIVFYAKLHMIVATHAKTHFQIPQSDFQMLQKSKACTEVLSTLRGSRHAGLSALPLLFDVYPYLVQIVQPAMRATNETLYTKKEKDQIEHTIQVMIDYSLTFVPTTIDNDTKFVFQPPIDQVVQYPVTSSESSGTDLPNAARQMIAKKIELIKLGSSFSAISVDDSEDVPERSETPGGSSRMKQIEEQERNKNCSRTEAPVPETSGTIGQVHYRYNQGFSNAVKKPVRMMDLLN
ncbi:hypothetical protein WR25_23172 isoform D [Diploscapter pachys]|nr:hypothetical protein WR25_23172 isoform A [Diploscapter pachys]PAV91723.1 hypothetical protein WR25_23172 isoform C [Diploscapter pachys]PAV91724.1 hypothetical protein WR25_23172 isoform D [Diploscapter pachys]